MEIAAEHSEAHCQSAGQCMKKWLLLDGIELECTDVSMWHEQFPSAIEADAANTVQSVENDAAMSARKTPQFAVLQVLV
jgi:hypothetical protein